MSAGPKPSYLLCLAFLFCMLRVVVTQHSGIAPAGGLDVAGQVIVSPGFDYWIDWVGGDGVSTITITLMQGPDYDHLTTIQILAHVDPVASYLGYSWNPSTTIANGKYTIQLDQVGSPSNWFPFFTLTGGGVPLSSSKPSQSSSSSVNTASSSTSGQTSNTNPPSSVTTASLSSKTTSSSGFSAISSSESSTLTPLPSVPTIRSTAILENGNLTPGARLLTGSCTSTILAHATNYARGEPFEYALVGCAVGKGECCPFSFSVESNDTHDGIPYYYSDIAVCPADYAPATSSSYTLCCPKDWQIYSTNIDNKYACYTTPTTLLPTPTPPMTVSFSWNSVYPSYVVQTFIADKVFAAAFRTSSALIASNGNGLSTGAIVGIVIGACVFCIIVAIIVFVLLQRKWRQRFARERAFAAEAAMLPAMTMVPSSPGPPLPATIKRKAVPTVGEREDSADSITSPVSPVELGQEEARRRATELEEQNQRAVELNSHGPVYGEVGMRDISELEDK